MEKPHSHICKGLSTEQDNENSHNCECHPVFHRKYKHARCFAGNILQNLK